MKPIDKQIRGHTGVFFAAGMLSLRGYVAGLTWANYPDVDIFIMNPRNGKQASIQVKSHAFEAAEKRWSYYPLLPGNSDFFVFVDIIKEGDVQYRIVPTGLVSRMAETNYKEYVETHQKSKETHRWIDMSNIDQYKNRWDFIEDFLK